MEGHAVALQQFHKVLRRVARKRRAAETRVLRDEVGRRGVAVGEVAAPAAGDANFLGDFLGVVNHQNPHAQLSCHPGAEQACGTGTHNHRVKRLHGSECRRCLHGASRADLRDWALLDQHHRLGRARCHALRDRAEQQIAEPGAPLAA